MSDRAFGPLQRLKILYLYKILTEQTDEDHGLTLVQIMDQLEAQGISAARKALYEDIEALRAFGLDITGGSGRFADYRVLNREFELPELKLLTDAVCSAKFLTEKKARELSNKLTTLCSTYQAKQLRRQVYVSGRANSMNEKVYINVDAINRAISEHKQITFRYFDYDVNKRRVYRKGERVCTPYSLVWDDERYYMVAFYEKRQEINHFRVDRMENVELMDTPARRLPQGFSLPDYMYSTFSMFSGTDRDVKLLFDNDLVNAALDRFGKDIKLVPYDDGHFTAHVTVKVGAPFFGWLFGFGGKIKLLSPDDVVQQYKDMLQNAIRNEE